MDPSTRGLSLSGKVQGSQEMRLNSILLLKARARGDVFLSVFIWPWHGRDKCLPVQHRHSEEYWRGSSILLSVSLSLMPCALQLHIISRCLCLLLCPFAAILSPTRTARPQNCTESSPLFSAIKLTWSLKHGETRCIMQRWLW